jgi:phosphate transport system protein
MSKHLEHELDKLERQLLALGALVEEHMHGALKAFETRDVALAEKVIAADEKVDEMEVELEEECLKILALYQPVAIDLRFIISALKINNDLERVGDLATGIAKRARRVAQLPPIEIPFDFREMAERALGLLRLSLDSFVKMDTRLANEVRLLDREIDKRNREVEQYVMEAVKKEPTQEEVLFQLVLISRALERIGDHATNIAEDIIYMLEGEIIRHTARKEKRLDAPAAG